MVALYKKAEDFICRCYEELNKPQVIRKRLAEIKLEIDRKGTYDHTFEELEHGAKMAWRNANKCIGRLFWDTLAIKDERDSRNEKKVFQALENHIRYATNEGRIRPTMTIFSPRKNEESPVRILNHQLIRYAGYEREGKVIGDPASVSFTKLCLSLGWQSKETDFDLLPLVIKLNSGKLIWRTLNEGDILQVAIEHPEISEINGLNMKWYAVPIISDMLLEIGGVEYPTAPFNGWYMGTEIGARNLADEGRYHLLPAIAEKMRLDTSKASSLWKDQALVELNRAVLDSFQKNEVSIVDHHTAAEQFKTFEKKEHTASREITGTWSWLIPPMSPATTNIFHKNYNDQMVSPNFHYQKQLFDEQGNIV